MNILLLASHSVAEYDDIRMFVRMGHDVFCPGGYQDPRNPGESLRPAISEAPFHPELVEVCESVRREGGEPGAMIDWAKAFLHPDVIDWADIIICHHFPERWIGGQWQRIRHKRVVWRTCGQSDPRLEHEMSRYRADGLQIVRYSPRERQAFKALGVFAGEDALIRFGKDPEEWSGWTGEDRVVGNITQDMDRRGEACGYSFWQAATDGLSARPAGPGSERLPGGIGALAYDDMRAYLRRTRVYLYTGTQPASYTLALIEAMMTGVPIVSVPPSDWMWLPELFEAHEFADIYAGPGSDVLQVTRSALDDLLRFDDAARAASAAMREMAITYFGLERISTRWQAFLDGRELDPEPVVSHFPSQRQLALA